MDLPSKLSAIRLWPAGLPEIYFSIWYDPYFVGTMAIVIRGMAPGHVGADNGSLRIDF